MPPPILHAPVLRWYAEAARDLPWRSADRSPWGVLVSEVMLQQTPVERVVPAWTEWMDRWPTPAALAAEAPGEAVRMWGRLGYPRRALRLHEAARDCVARFGGQVPTEESQLLSLPGVGEYTAAAVAAFAFGRRAVVLDTNVRRVYARALQGSEQARPTITAAERALGASILPDLDAEAALWSVAVMELGALVCTSASPVCAACPIAASCAWVALGKPAYDGPARPVQRFTGTDRQVRGLLMAVLRSSAGAVAKASLDVVWSEAVQRERALDGLVTDGLVEVLDDGRYALPGTGATIEG